MFTKFIHKKLRCIYYNISLARMCEAICKFVQVMHIASSSQKFVTLRCAILLVACVVFYQPIFRYKLLTKNYLNFQTILCASFASNSSVKILFAWCNFFWYGVNLQSHPTSDKWCSCFARNFPLGYNCFFSGINVANFQIFSFFRKNSSKNAIFLLKNVIFLKKLLTQT